MPSLSKAETKGDGAALALQLRCALIVFASR